MREESIKCKIFIDEKKTAMRTAYQYPKGTVRWRIFGGDYDIRGYPAPKG